MATLTSGVRPASDIEADIRRFIREFDPLKQGVHHIAYEVDNDGVVTLRGNVRAAVARRVLVDNVPDFAGVTQMNADELYDDDTLRFAVGKLLPAGIYSRVNYGHVTLAGVPAEGLDTEALVAKVEAIDGVVRVITQFS